MAYAKLLWAAFLAAVLAIIASLSGCNSEAQPGISGSFELVLPGTHIKTSGRITPPKVAAPVEPAIAPVLIPPSPAITDK